MSLKYDCLIFIIINYIYIYVLIYLLMYIFKFIFHVTELFGFMNSDLL